MRPSHGAARTLVLTVLGLAVVLVGLAVSMLVSDDDGPFDAEDPFAEDVDAGSRGRGVGGVGAQRDRDRDDEEFDDDIVLPGRRGPGARTPEGDVLYWSAEDLAEALDRRIFEEVRRQIARANREGKAIPREIIESLVELLKGDDTRIDAKLCLGMLHDDETGRLLGEFAANPAYSLAARKEALGALAESGQKAALSYLQALAVDPDLDPKLTGTALLALAAIDSDDAARTLIEYLRAHPNDRSTSAAVAALGKSVRGAAVMAETFRSAAASGDQELAWMMIRAAGQQGPAAEEELRAELRRVVQDPNALAFVEDEGDRRRMRSSAISSAVRIGLVEEVILLAETGEKELQGAAYYALRQARGDAAAKNLSAAIARSVDSQAKWNLMVALGQTGSRSATTTLVDNLDSTDQNLQQAASSGLAQIRDPKAVAPILERVGRTGNHYVIDQNYVKALGTIGSDDALPKLRELLAKGEAEEGHWSSLTPWVRNAIKRIESGNPESKSMK